MVCGILAGGCNKLQSLLHPQKTNHSKAQPRETAAAHAHADHDSAAGGARLAILLDDLGNDRGAASNVFALGFPLTISVLPNHEYSAEIAEQANQRGLQVMLHLPMQAQGKEKPEREELRPGMPAREVSKELAQMLAGVPHVVGVNNHQGSLATSNEALMSELMPLLQERNLFFVDSRTTAATVAFELARRDSVRCAFRNVPFLDDVQTVPAIRKQLELAIRGAKEKGEAIAIGHPHPETLEALREVLPEAQAQGVRLVHVSELVH
jgi:polysaccharide deacetylase 2 family uncharacterized protein YibQ